MIIIKEIFIGKATGHNDHHMMNMGDQRPKIGGNWLSAALICSAAIQFDNSLCNGSYD